MSAERVDKFYEDAEKLIAGRNLSKISAEVGKLRTWLQKHQYDVLPDGNKGKLLQILVSYQRYFQALRDSERETFESALSSLLSDYLQLPEGKLVAAKDKKKVMGWLQALSNSPNGGTAASSAIDSEERQYLLQDIDEETKSVTIQSIVDEAQWLEGLQMASETLFQQLLRRFQEGEENIRVSYDEVTGLVST